MMEEQKGELTRRGFLTSVVGAGAIAGLAGTHSASLDHDKSPARIPVCIFSKHLQWLNWEEMAETAAELGFDGVDLTVRDDGHVLPARVRLDLPKAVEIVRKAGLEVPMITAGIADAQSPYAEDIVRTASELGIRRYRWGWFYWADYVHPPSLKAEESEGLFLRGGKTIPGRLAELVPRVEGLEELNKKYDVCAMYHNDYGPMVGDSLWDEWLIIKDFSPRWISSNYDISQATIEGGWAGWINSARLLGEGGRIKGAAFKDFTWEQHGRSDWNFTWQKQGSWRPHFCPLGEGMVHFKAYLALLKEAKFSGPVQLHFEYPLGGADEGARTLTIAKSRVLFAMRRDLATLRRMLRDAQLA
jgi:sugar phosphate isomerase/epimerase